MSKSDERNVVLDAMQRKKIAESLDTQIGVFTRRMNAEKNDAIKAIVREDIAFLVNLKQFFIA